MAKKYDKKKMYFHSWPQPTADEIRSWRRMYFTAFWRPKGKPVYQIVLTIGMTNVKFDLTEEEFKLLCGFKKLQPDNWARQPNPDRPEVMEYVSSNNIILSCKLTKGERKRGLTSCKFYYRAQVCIGMANPTVISTLLKDIEFACIRETKDYDDLFEFVQKPAELPRPSMASPLTAHS